MKDMDQHLYILKDMLWLNVVVLLPADLEKDRDVWPDFSPFTNVLWKPSLGRHGNAFSRTHYLDFGAPCRLLPVLQSSYPALWRCVWLLRLAKHLLPKPHQYVYKSTEPSVCHWAEKAGSDPLSSSNPSKDHRAFSRACFCAMFLSPEQQKDLQ